MTRISTLVVSALLFTLPVAADVIYLNGGQQYYGHLMGEREARLAFQDNQGVQYNFPFHDLKSISFNQAGQTIVLRDGKTYFGQIHGPQANTIDWMDKQGISYHFPTYDVRPLRSLTGRVRMKAIEKAFFCPPGPNQRADQSPYRFTKRATRTDVSRADYPGCHDAGRPRCHSSQFGRNAGTA